MSQHFNVGDFVTIPFGGKSTQTARVESFTRDGRLRVRAYVTTKGCWMPNLRTVPNSPDVVLCETSDVVLASYAAWKRTHWFTKAAV